MVIKFTNQFIGVILIKKSRNLSIEKSGRFVIFWTRFWTFLSVFDSIGIYRKTGPTKSTVLGPGPPPWEKHKIYRKITFFWVLGAFNRAGKTVSKIGIYALPPQKWSFYWIFINSRPNFGNCIPFYIWSLAYFLYSSIFWSRVLFLLWEKPNSFSVIWIVFGLLLVCWSSWFFENNLQTEKRQAAPKKGRLRRSSRQ
jgi:hypothetical protein